METKLDGLSGPLDGPCGPLGVPLDRPSLWKSTFLSTLKSASPFLSTFFSAVIFFSSFLSTFFPLSGDPNLYA